MWLWWGRTAVVTMADGSAVRGRVRWSWMWGWLLLDQVEDMSGEQPREVPGKILIPIRSIVVVQVV